MDLPKESDDPKELPLAPRFGRAFHKTMELHLEGNVPSIEAISLEFDVDPKRLLDFYRRASEYVDGILKKNGWDKEERWIERKLAYDPFSDKARFLKSKSERDYHEKRRTELPGTGDLILPSTEVGFVAFDWKSGVKDYDAEQNGQLKSLSLATSRIVKSSNIDKKATVGIKVILRIDDEFMEPYEAPTNLEELDEHRKLLKIAIRNAIGMQPSMRPGSYCNWCPALALCPAQAGGYNTPALLRDLMNGSLDRPQMGMVYGRLLAGENLLRKVRDKIAEDIRNNGPLPLDTGGYVALVPGSRSNLSQASIKRALGADADSVLDQLEKAGCIETSNYESLRIIQDLSSRKK